MKFRKKPIIIEAVEFQPEVEPWPMNVSADLEAESGYSVYNELHRSSIMIRPGDMIRIDDPNDTYPIDRKTFEATYEAHDHE